METWRLLAGACVMLVLWAGLLVALGHRPNAFEVLTAPLFAVIGIYLGQWLSNRMAGDGD